MNSQSRKARQLKFANALKQKLTERFGKIPTASHLANQFNLRAHGTEPITQEAARRWIKGLSLPQIEHFQVLNSWLGLRVHEFLEMTQEGNFSSQAFALCNMENDFIALFRNLNSAEQNALQVAAKTMLDARRRF